jgi:hypothetical protein
MQVRYYCATFTGFGTCADCSGIRNHRSQPFKAQWLLYVPPGLAFTNSTFCPHSEFMCFVWISEQTAIISLYGINRLVFVTEAECLLRGTDWVFHYNSGSFLSKCQLRHSCVIVSNSLFTRIVLQCTIWGKRVLLIRRHRPQAALCNDRLRVVSVTSKYLLRWTAVTAVKCVSKAAVSDSLGILPCLRNLIFS